MTQELQNIVISDPSTPAGQQVGGFLVVKSLPKDEDLYRLSYCVGDIAKVINHIIAESAGYIEAKSMRLDKVDTMQ